MSCNENIIKNMANEIVRNCQINNVSVEADFTIYFIELMLLSPKYNLLFAKNLNRSKLEYFVNRCVECIITSKTALSTVKMQHKYRSNYAKLGVLKERHLDHIEMSLKPLVTEILEEDHQPKGLDNLKKSFRKISIYLIMASGLGVPSSIQSIKEGLAALESVFTIQDLKVFIEMTRYEKINQLNDLLALVSGVRLFNRDCHKGGEYIAELTFDLMDACRACVNSLSHSLLSLMTRISAITAALSHGVIIINEETETVEIANRPDISETEVITLLQLLTFNRQYEIYIRKLLADSEKLLERSTSFVENFNKILIKIHEAVKYKSAVPVNIVFPLFTRLWQEWKNMQIEMYCVSVINQLIIDLNTLKTKEMASPDILTVLTGKKKSIGDPSKAILQLPNPMRNTKVSMDAKSSVMSLKKYMSQVDSNFSNLEGCIQFLGFCTMCLNVGALIPSNSSVDIIVYNNNRYGFCSDEMARIFRRNPQRYINQVIDFVRNNQEYINLLNLSKECDEVKSIRNIVTKVLPPLKIFDKEIQTEVHAIESYIEKNYSWDLWEHKKRACQWANIVNCRTHSTQTYLSHLRTEVPCQTTDMKNKRLQTMKEIGVNAAIPYTYKPLKNYYEVNKINEDCIPAEKPKNYFI